MTTKCQTLIAFCIGMVLFVIAAPLMAEETDPRMTPLVRAVQRVQTSVVNIHTEKTTYPDEALFAGDKPRKVSGMGSGIIIDPRGYLVTNHHVINGVDLDSLQVTLHDGSMYHAEIVSYDSKHDLAVLKISASNSLEVMPLGTSSDLRLGESVIALGNPYGYKHTVTAGIVSSLSRDVEVNEHQTYENLIQTDTSINPGNSGGPLVNMLGEVIGINVAIRAGAQRIGFAIPIDDARVVIRKLLSIERLDHHAHGLISRDHKTGKQKEMIVEASRGPALKAGLQTGDVIVAVNNQTVLDAADFERLLLGKSIEEAFTVVVRRNNEKQELKLHLADSSSRKEDSGHQSADHNVVFQTPAVDDDPIWMTLGLRLIPTAVTSDRYRGGMKVLDVRKDSTASRNGIRSGDVLVGLHKWETVNYDNISYVLEHPQLQSFAPLRFFILRGQETRYGNLQLSPASPGANVSAHVATQTNIR
ncbi:Putative serine protease HhoB precursor [Polystyrenella longa]|uniref:Serine protease HhoB n=1 Tax=Polystyrenella longa TaxID=2528007 RepID=A0A518CSP3_9PLAN|nr:trypsin-like peptidase domain-containing protein [Polystyrenella longa]QDU82235.1 Putative serine protease HhoB precursor [Polystyrenella longa]